MQCYQTVRELRWPDGIACPSCQSKKVIKRGFDDTELARQRYECHDCHTRFDDLTDTIFAGHHQPLKVWVLCRYFMGLNLSNEPIAQELDVDLSDVQQMTTQLREGILAHTRLACCRATYGWPPLSRWMACKVDSSNVRPMKRPRSVSIVLVDGQNLSNVINELRTNE